ncbi:ScyD/ScyE family protein [Nocardioides dongkuii]|uniref:ScyD/ScyE family protein n=1 Tax=Nocardioides dongkuii TaxID=2760089 RepID=UPI0015F9C2EF|nr:ScyD/ScyE family protein [Nocardioides dongkuii]
MTRSHRLLAATSAAVLAATLLPAASGTATADKGRHHGHGGHLRVVADLESPRGVDNLGPGRTLVSEGDGSFSLVVERRHRDARVIPLGTVPGAASPAIAASRRGTVYILTGAGEPGTGAATLYTWRRGDAEPTALADIAAYQAEDLDPYDLEELPADSNPYGIAVLGDGSAVIADAAGNDVLKVTPEGDITTLARLMPRTVAVPDSLPDTDPEGNPLPPAGTQIPAEAVATSVAVGRDGSVYVGELRGFPATPGTSQVWRIAPGAEGADCDPAAPYAGDCTRVADGLTSIVDLAIDRRGVIYALSLSRLSWLAWELGLEGSEIGSLHALERTRRGTTARELFRGRLVNPAGVDAGGRSLYLTGPIFGPGTLSKATVGRHHHRGRR